MYVESAPLVADVDWMLCYPGSEQGAYVSAWDGNLGGLVVMFNGVITAGSVRFYVANVDVEFPSTEIVLGPGQTMGSLAFYLGDVSYCALDQIVVRVATSADFASTGPAKASAWLQAF